MTKGPAPFNGIVGNAGTGKYPDPFIFPEPAPYRQGGIVSYEVRAKKKSCDQADGMVSKRMAVEIVYKKADAAVFLKPPQLVYQFFICKMVAEEGGENNVRFIFLP